MNFSLYANMAGFCSDGHIYHDQVVIRGYVVIKIKHSEYFACFYNYKY